MDIFTKCYNFTRARQAVAEGWYPYFLPIESGPGTKVLVNGRKMIMIGSNNYMGLTGHPKVIEASVKATKKYGTGCTGSRFLNGTLDIHLELEDRLAKFVGKEAALCFSTGFQTNQGAISALVGKDDIVFVDRENHASIVDGYRLSFGKVVKYKHNDFDDLERVLKLYEKENAGKVIVTDGVFSMEGTIARIPDIVKLAEKYGARLYVDDAHALGVLGKHGKGSGEYWNMTDHIDLVMGTFSKSLASLGGFIAGESIVVDYIKHHARSLIFSASMPPSAVAAVIASLDIIESEPERVERLWKNTRMMKEGFESLGFNTGESNTPIIPIVIGTDEACFTFWKMLFDAGIFANPAISPAVSPGQAIIRTSYMATHTEEELNYVLDIFKKIGKESGII
ncbi:MAG TPA: aminotransferase class I/II-fold pyridoxal phosphate-dependent enzyme [Bacteroidetes bacterium]|nr:aminotransferase class I/II-fold pyridoxal phosphate-dependent enzyme [Bacteroidota bacterium]